MNRNNLILILIYSGVAVLVVSTMVYMNNHYLDILHNENPELVKYRFGQTVSEVTFSRNLNVNKDALFKTISDVKKYPIIIPEYYNSVNITNQSNDVIYTKETLLFKGIKWDFHVKHTFIPNETQTIEISDGDAAGSTITVIFDGKNTTKLTIHVISRLVGVLEPFSFLVTPNSEKILDPIIDDFVNYTNDFNIKSKKSIDTLYLKLLNRHADTQALEYYGSMLDNNSTTLDDIRKTIVNSEEYKNSLKPVQIKTIYELKHETKTTIDDIYVKLLNRHADSWGMEYYGSILESNKTSVNEIVKTITNSDEYKSIHHQ